MQNLLAFKMMLIRTPLERPAFALKHALDRFAQRRVAGLEELMQEDRSTDIVLHRLLTSRSNCIDVGTHIGSTLSLILRLAPEGKHLAFEPVPQKAAWLRRKFPEVDVRQAAAGDVPGTITFFENVSRPGFSGQFATSNPGDKLAEITVECCVLDRIVPSDRPVKLLKIDVEGAEFNVLRGAVELLKRDRPALLFESIPGLVDRFGSTRRELFEFLTRDLGYAIFTPMQLAEGAGPLDWDGFDRSHHYPFRALNYFAIMR